MGKRRLHHPREMKIDPNFVPCEERVGDEFYPNGIFVK